MSLSAFSASAGTRESSAATPSLANNNDPVAQLDEISPPVSRAEVLEVFESWRNSASVTGRSDDSGLGQGSSTQSESQAIKTKGKGGKRPVNKHRKALRNNSGEFSETSTQSNSVSQPAASVSSSSNNETTMNQQQPAGSKLPRIGAKKASRQSTMHSLHSPPGHAQQNNQLQVNEEKRRFVTVVRPLSVFPEPALPPNYTPPVFNYNQQPQQQQQSNGFSNRYHDFSPGVQLHHPVRGRPPSPAPFQRQQRLPNNRGGINGNFSLAGQGVGYDQQQAPGSAALRVNLAGGSGWDLTAIKRGYNYVGPPKNYNGSYKSLTDRSLDPVARYQSQNALDQEEKISMPPWNPHFGYSKVLSQQNLPLTDDWRRHIDARRKALQRRRTKRRGVADGGTTFGANGERFYNGTAQTDGNFEELLRRAGDTDTGIQTELPIENVKRRTAVGANNLRTQDGSTQVVLSEIPDFDKGMGPAIEQLVSSTLEQAFIEMLEEEEIKAIRDQRIQFQQLKLAEITTSRLMNVTE